eukprot:GDKJ01019754.1.p1 GENE.GDKJ01019754.1~~GDKJ01019754.1.p1  ORF type:complete len:215 (+),score=24.28 GDKJ01019754.1:812-1456(+)
MRITTANSPTFTCNATYALTTTNINNFCFPTSQLYFDEPFDDDRRQRALLLGPRPAGSRLDSRRQVDGVLFCPSCQQFCACPHWCKRYLQVQKQQHPRQSLLAPDNNGAVPLSNDQVLVFEVRPASDITRTLSFTSTVEENTSTMSFRIRPIGILIGQNTRNTSVKLQANGQTTTILDVIQGLTLSVTQMTPLISNSFSFTRSSCNTSTFTVVW